MVFDFISGKIRKIIFVHNHSFVRTAVHMFELDDLDLGLNLDHSLGLVDDCIHRFERDIQARQYEHDAIHIQSYLLHMRRNRTLRAHRCRYIPDHIVVHFERGSHQLLVKHMQAMLQLKLKLLIVENVFGLRLTF